MATSLFDLIQSGSFSMVPVKERLVIYKGPHTVKSGRGSKEVVSLFLGVDTKRPLSYVEMQSLLLVFDATPGNKRRYNLARKDDSMSKELKAKEPGRNWYWLASEQLLLVKSQEQVAAEVREAVANWRENLLSYILDSALPLPWEKEGVVDDSDESDAPAPAAEPTKEELMALWLQVQNAAKGQQYAPRVQQFAVPNGTPSTMTRIG